MSSGITRNENVKTHRILCQSTFSTSSLSRSCCKWVNLKNTTTS